MTYTKNITGQVKPAKKINGGPEALYNAIVELDRQFNKSTEPTAHTFTCVTGKLIMEK